MDEITANLIKDIVTDAIKILGPAIIAIITTYKLAKKQFEYKLAEIEKNNNFAAREYYFSYYKDRQKQLDDDSKKLNHELGNFLGFAVGYVGTDENEAENNLFLSTFSRMFVLYKHMMPIEIDVTLKDMNRNGYGDGEEYQTLSRYKDRVGEITDVVSIENIKNNIYLILEIFAYLKHCNNIVMQDCIDNVFGEGIKNA